MKQVDGNGWKPANRMDSVFNVCLIGAGLAVLLAALVSPLMPAEGGAGGITTAMVEAGARARG